MAAIAGMSAVQGLHLDCSNSEEQQLICIGSSACIGACLHTQDHAFEPASAF